MKIVCNKSKSSPVTTQEVGFSALFSVLSQQESSGGISPIRLAIQPSLSPGQAIYWGRERGVVLSHVFGTLVVRLADSRIVQVNSGQYRKELQPVCIDQFEPTTSVARAMEL